MMYGVQVLPQPEPLEGLQPARSDQAIGVLIARRILVGDMRPVCKPVRGEHASEVVAKQDHPSQPGGRNERQQGDAPAH